MEVIFEDGSALDVDQYSDVDLLSDSLMRLRAGRVRLSILRGARRRTIAWMRLPGRSSSAPPGTTVSSSVKIGDAELDVAVLHGTAELQNAAGRTLVRAGTHARASSARSRPSRYVFNSAVWDVFDRWSEDQRDARLGSSSSRYLPADLRYYGGELDRSGSWGSESSYGNVWYPRVDADWRPYYSGHWSFVARIGWLWIGADRWSWPTHHYGRWGVSDSRWFWIPDRRWSPAWVSWASAPGYVSWCPLGYDGRPVISIVDFSCIGQDGRFSPRGRSRRTCWSRATWSIGAASPPGAWLARDAQCRTSLA